MSISIETKLNNLPSMPGIYLFKDSLGKVIYAGKATNLHQRVNSYFGPSTKLTPKLIKLIANIDNLEFMITYSEQEALILECNLIKKYRPRYNVRLKDDKTFPYLKIDLHNDWPGVYVTRHLKKDGSKYFGPFVSAGSLRKTLKLIKRIFPFRCCSKAITGTDTRPCLNYHIHRCLGPCTGAVGEKEYAEIIKQVILFLEGKQEMVVRELKNQMKQTSKQLQFEKSALLRDQITALENIIEGQRIAVTVRGTMDAIGMVQKNDLAYVEVFFIRKNKLMGRDYIVIEGTQDESHQQIMNNFVKQYYASASFIPPTILLQHSVEEHTIITEWLEKIRGSSVRLIVPKMGAKKELIDIVVENARQGLEIYQAKQPSVIEFETALTELKQRLNLPVVPLRIEGYDISNTGGNLSVGSMVVFEKAMPKKVLYRRFKIKTISQIDDYSMIQEVLRRRFHNYLGKKEKWAIVPDLILIDGGKGHLNAALQIMKEMNLDSLPIASIAKENEDIFIPAQVKPVDIPKNSMALHVLQRVRDESHRFALRYHQKLRSKKSVASVLDSIPGIGPKRKKALIQRFGSMQGIKEATKEDLLSIKGVTNKLAATIKEYL
jgi:excinuclease ABC subunit C